MFQAGYGPVSGVARGALKPHAYVGQ